MGERPRCGVCTAAGTLQSFRAAAEVYELWVCPYGHGVIRRSRPTDHAPQVAAE
jgi:hypothetical protein